MPAPANNLFASRTVIDPGALPYSLASIDNTDCIEEASEPLFIYQGDGTVADASAGFKHLWWEFTPTVTQNYLILISNNSPSFGVFTGSALGALTEVASWDTKLNITLTAGVSYKICIISWNGSPSTVFNFSLTAAPGVPGQQLQTAREITSWPLSEEIDGSLLTERGPVSSNQRVVAYKMTFTEETYLSFWVHKGTGASTIDPYVGVFSEANWNIFDWPDDWPYLFNYVGVNYPVIVAFIPGTYYFYATYFNATPLAQNIAIDVEQWTNPTSFPEGTLLIQDDRGVLPAQALDPDTGEFLGFVPGVPSGEYWFVDTASGKTLMENPFGATLYPFEDAEGFVLFDADWTKVWSLVVDATYQSGITGDGNGKFYVAGLTPHPSSFVRQVGRIDVSTPAIEATWDVDMDGGASNIHSMTVSLDNEVLYYTEILGGGSVVKKVHRWDLLADTALATFVTSATHEPVREMLTMSDGAIVVAWYKNDGTSFVRRYDAAAATLNTLNLPEATSLEIRMWHDADPENFWVWTKKADAISQFRKVRASDMTVLVTFDQPWFQSGLLGSEESETPAARFGHSFSCGGIITRAAIDLGGEDPEDPDGPDGDGYPNVTIAPGTPGPYVWVHIPLRSA